MRRKDTAKNGIYQIRFSIHDAGRSQNIARGCTEVQDSARTLIKRPERPSEPEVTNFISETSKNLKLGILKSSSKDENRLSNIDSHQVLEFISPPF